MSWNERQPTIWIVNHYAITPDLPGGTRHFELAAELVRRGYRTRVLACDYNRSLGRRVSLGPSDLFREEVCDGVIFTWVKAASYSGNNWGRAWNMITFMFNVFRVGWLLTESPICVIGSSPHPLAALAAWGLSVRKRARYILELRDLWPQALVDMGISENSVSVRAMRLLERFLYKAAEVIIVLAFGSRDYLIRRCVEPQRVVLIPNGVHLSRFGSDNTFSRDCLRVKYGFDRFTVIYAGAHGPANSLITLIEAADRLRAFDSVQFVLVGGGPEKERLVSEARTRGLNNVRFRDPVPKTEIPGLLKAADCAVITLRDVPAFAYAVSPNKLFDYMAAEKPIICAVPGDMARLVAEVGCGVVVAPEQPEELANAVIRLSSLSQAELDRMGKIGRRFVEKNYDRRVLAGVLEQVCVGRLEVCRECSSVGKQDDCGRQSDGSVS